MTATPPRESEASPLFIKAPNVWLAFRAIVRSSFTVAKRTNGKDPGGKERRNAPVAKRVIAGEFENEARTGSSTSCPCFRDAVSRDRNLVNVETRKSDGKTTSRSNIEREIGRRERGRERKGKATSERRNTCRAFDGRDLTEIASPIGRKEELIASLDVVRGASDTARRSDA